MQSARTIDRALSNQWPAVCMQHAARSHLIHSNIVNPILQENLRLAPAMDIIVNQRASMDGYVSPRIRQQANMIKSQHRIPSSSPAAYNPTWPFTRLSLASELFPSSARGSHWPPRSVFCPPRPVAQTMKPAAPLRQRAPSPSMALNFYTSADVLPSARLLPPQPKQLGSVRAPARNPPPVKLRAGMRRTDGASCLRMPLVIQHRDCCLSNRSQRGQLQIVRSQSTRLLTERPKNAMRK
jgi:hypothetical protein